MELKRKQEEEERKKRVEEEKVMQVWSFYMIKAKVPPLQPVLRNYKTHASKRI